jgi:hypothetical protein
MVAKCEYKNLPYRGGKNAAGLRGLVLGIVGFGGFVFCSFCLDFVCVWAKQYFSLCVCVCVCITINNVWRNL